MKSRLLEQNRLKLWIRNRFIPTVFLMFLQTIFFSPCAYSKVPLLYRWEDNDRISIRVIGSQEIISKPTEGGETITQPAVGPFGERHQMKKVLSSKAKYDENQILIRKEVEINDSDGSFIKRIILDKEEVDDFRYYGGMSPKENFLIYQTQKNGKWTLWADPLIKGTAPIPVFTQQDYIRAALSSDETKFALITTHQEWRHSILIIRLNDISDPFRVTLIEEPYYTSNHIEWSPNGTYIAYISDRKAYLVSESGNQKVLLTNNIDSYFGFKWSKNNLYFITNNMLMETNLINPEESHMLLKLPQGTQNFLTELSPDKSKISTVTQEASKSKGKTIFRLWWNYVSKNELWKQLFEYEYNQVLQNPQR